MTQGDTEIEIFQIISLFSLVTYWTNKSPEIFLCLSELCALDNLHVLFALISHNFCSVRICHSLGTANCYGRFSAYSMWYDCSVLTLLFPRIDSLKHHYISDAVCGSVNYYLCCTKYWYEARNAHNAHEHVNKGVLKSSQSGSVNLTKSCACTHTHTHRMMVIIAIFFPSCQKIVSFSQTLPNFIFSLLRFTH